MVGPRLHRDGVRGPEFDPLIGYTGWAGATIGPGYLQVLAFR